MVELSVILGSGFSYYAELPLAKDINPYFLRDNKERVLRFGSGEFKWADFANAAELNNGRIDNSYIAFGIILNELVNLYQLENGLFDNYEKFYQFVLDGLNHTAFLVALKKESLNSFDKAFPELKKTTKYYEEYTRKIQSPDRREILSLINHLIADLLHVRVPSSFLQKEYSEFIEYLKHFENINFITLNHDTLLEYLLHSSIPAVSETISKPGDEVWIVKCWSPSDGDIGNSVATKINHWLMSPSSSVLIFSPLCPLFIEELLSVRVFRPSKNEYVSPSD